MIQALYKLTGNLDGLLSAQLRELVVMLLGKITALEQAVVEQRSKIARLNGMRELPHNIKPSAAAALSGLVLWSSYESGLRTN